MLTYAAGSTGATDPEYGFDFLRRRSTIHGPTGFAIDSANNFYVNGTLKSGFGSAYGLFVNAAANIGDPSASRSRKLPWNSTTELSAGIHHQRRAEQERGDLYRQLRHDGQRQQCHLSGRANVYAAGASGSGSGESPTRILTLERIQTQGTDCANTLSPLLFYFPSIQLYAARRSSWPTRSTTRSTSFRPTRPTER